MCAALICNAATACLHNFLGSTGKKKEEKKTLQALYCLPALSKNSAGGAQVLFWNAFAVGLCGILGVLMLQLMTISTIVDEKLPLLLIKCPGPVHGLTCKIYSCAPI